jgi:uncharacterized protein
VAEHPGDVTAAAGPARVTELHVYPLKGAHGVAVREMQIDDFGPHGDRRWLAVDGNGTFISQREVHRLALVRTALDGAALVLSADGHGSVRVEAPLEGERRRVRIWHDEADAIDAGAEGAAWLSTLLGQDVRLVRMPDDSIRPVDATYGQPGDRVSFADALPFLIASQASLDVLNARLPEKLPMNRFRPNIVVGGVGPYAEDGWTRIRVGAVPLDVVKPCARCVVTTIDQETAVAGREPLRELARYRKVGAGVMFGMNAIHRGRGAIRVGDAVEIGG